MEKKKHCDIGDLAKIVRILAFFWKNGRFLSNFDDFRKIYENAKNAYQMGCYEAKNDPQGTRRAL